MIIKMQLTQPIVTFPASVEMHTRLKMSFFSLFIFV
jgi:hypothetical protein